jgi:hypothetical protein
MPSVVRPGALLAEVVVWTVLAVLLVVQLLGYDVIKDPDPDGYVTYASHLKETWSLMDHRRLPGYPLFLVVVDSIGPSTMHIDAYRAQFGLYLGWAALLWLWARRLMGPLVGLVFLAILATPSFLTRGAVVMVADFLACVTFALSALVLYRAIKAPTRRRSAAWLGLLTLLAALAFVLHPSTRPMLAVLIGCLGFAAVVYREPIRLARLALALAMIAASTSAVSAVADRGSGQFILSSATMWVLVCLPPVADTEEDRAVEATKRSLADRLGHPAEHAIPQYYPEFAPLLAIPDARQQAMADARHQEMALERLLARPLGLPGCGAQQAFWRFPILAKQYAPFVADWRFVILSYPPENGTPRSTLFRTYGIEVTGVPDTASWDELWWPAVGEVVRIAWFLVTAGIGAASLVHRFRAPAFAALLAIVAWGCIFGLTLVLDSRYFLAFSPGIYLAEAVGIVAITKRLFRPLRRTFPERLRPSADSAVPASENV